MSIVGARLVATCFPSMSTITGFVSGAINPFRHVRISALDEELFDIKVEWTVPSRPCRTLSYSAKKTLVDRGFVRGRYEKKPAYIQKAYKAITGLIAVAALIACQRTSSTRQRTRNHRGFHSCRIRHMWYLPSRTSLLYRYQSPLFSNF